MKICSWILATKNSISRFCRCLWILISVFCLGFVSSITKLYVWLFAICIVVLFYSTKSWLTKECVAPVSYRKAVVVLPSLILIENSANSVVAIKLNFSASSYFFNFCVLLWLSFIYFQLFYSFKLFFSMYFKWQMLGYFLQK